MMKEEINRKGRKKGIGQDTVGVRRYLAFFAAGVGSLLILFGATANASSVEERLDQLNRLPEKSRTEALEKEARKEGEVVWYAAMASDRAGEVIKVFESKYPYLKVRFQPGGASRQIEQLLVEHRAKKQRADIINTRRSFVAAMAKAARLLVIGRHRALLCATGLPTRKAGLTVSMLSRECFFTIRGWFPATRRHSRSTIC